MSCSEGEFHLLCFHFSIFSSEMLGCRGAELLSTRFRYRNHHRPPSCLPAVAVGGGLHGLDHIRGLGLARKGACSEDENQRWIVELGTLQKRTFDWRLSYQMKIFQSFVTRKRCRLMLFAVNAGRTHGENRGEGATFCVGSSKSVGLGAVLAWWKLSYQILV